jgi:hypothetical protein
MIDPERTWGKPEGGGCWAELRKMGSGGQGRDAAREAPLLTSFGRTVAGIASSSPDSPPRRLGDREEELALALASHSGVADSKFRALATDPNRGRTHSIATALVRRLAGAYTALDTIEERRALRRGRCTKQRRPDPVDVEADTEDDRLSFLWRMYACSHLDLAVEIATAADSSAMSDAALRTRPRTAWPSKYETSYPWGTRCYWAGYIPRIAHIIQLCPWLGRSQLNKRRPLFHVIQKAFPGKGLSRKWDKIAADYCSGSRGRGSEVAAVTAAVMRCTLFGGYVGARGGFPAPCVALSVWRDMSEDPIEVVARVSREQPKVLLCAWQEFLVWSLGALDPLECSVAAGCDLEVFSAEVSERADECVRTLLGRRGPAAADAPASADEALAMAESACHRSYAQAQCGNRRPTNRPDFTALFVRSVNTRIRNKEAARAKTSTPAPKEMELRSARPIGGSTVAAAAKTASVVAPWKWSVTDIHDAMRLAGIPPRVARTVAWLSDMYSVRTVTDDCVKLSLNKALDSVDGQVLRSARACMASVAFAGAMSVMPLSASTIERQLEIVDPERRFAFVCPSHWIVGATCIAANKRTGTAGIHRGLKFVSYGMGIDALLCNKQIKAPRITSRVGGGNRMVQEVAVGGSIESRSKTSCGVRMITIPTIGVMIRIKNAAYASCEVCGAFAKLEPTCWCVDGRIVCPVHADPTPPSATSPPPPPPVPTPADLGHVQCAVCRSRWHQADNRMRLRVYGIDDSRLSLSVVSCCARHFAASYPPLPTLEDREMEPEPEPMPRLVSLPKLRKDYLQYACSMDTMRNPYNRRPASLSAFLRSSCLTDLSVGDKPPPAKKQKRCPRTLAAVAKIKGMGYKGQCKPRCECGTEGEKAGRAPRPAPPPIRPVSPPTDSAASWDGFSSPLLDMTIATLLARGHKT